MDSTSARKHTQVRMGGEAGQGVILAGVLLAQAGMADDRQVAQSARYGAAVRGGEATADVVLSDEPIDYPHVEQPDILVVLSQPTYDKFVPLQKAGTTVVYDPFFVTAADHPELKQHALAATQRAIDLFGKGTSANLIILGFLSQLTEVVSKESLVSAVEKGVSPKFREANLKALEEGRALGEEVSG